MPKIPLVEETPLESRDGTLSRGGLLANCFVETTPPTCVYMRPGLALAQAGSHGAGGWVLGTGSSFFIVRGVTSTGTGTATATTTGTVYTLARGTFT